ncbi:hypothetical protein PUNSTDRAFT_56214 [Punctularia strigosozonata HHB-11173 SS5]|uniref:Autophagy-related protein 4 n=1 Tax=Punctularia strigosozonata (strain HHB-11173) TaxID=741275 RepID=R7S2K6_PUNST|nr:uncharacterized protein PUNSTDRAFT_56214 [Punctularia strigosozonata HHB-11173 SS5]EIN03481.1 hypothetical protein PUNSTDRAFT_56214 [Punctularia strigosozonata HHB-11173 SS5]
MSTAKHNRGAGSGSSENKAPTKLPKFLQKAQSVAIAGRDRSKSVSQLEAQAAASPTPTASSSSSSTIPETPKTSRSSRFIRPRTTHPAQDDIGTASPQPRPSSSSITTAPSLSTAMDPTDFDAETPVIVEPASPPPPPHPSLAPPSSTAQSIPIPRPRTRSERVYLPGGSVSDSAAPPTTTPHYATSTLASPSRTSGGGITDLSTRLSGWFNHTFSSSTTDLTLPGIIAQSVSASNYHSNSPASPTSGRKTNPLLTAAKHGKGHLDKAMRYLLDSDATPDRCTDPIWLLGVKHPGYEPPPPLPAAPSTPPPAGGRRTSGDGRSPTFRATASTSTTASSSPSSFVSIPPPVSASGSKAKNDPAALWPPVFYADFTSRVWVTYRSHFQPIRDTTLSALESDFGEQAQSANTSGNSVVSGSPSSGRRWWGGEKGWTSDAGWGCMLRTGQSLLANALLHLHLGRDWRRPSYPQPTAAYASYVQLLTWFFDSPSPLCPFSVHRMALAGKELGKDVGQWFGPSTAAGAIKTLVHAFPGGGLGVAVAVDGVVYETDVFSASHSPDSRRHHRTSTWGDRGVLILIGIRLGLDGVNPIYYDTIKELYTWPQSVGIAGGRPSSSYYFVGSQADSLFYLDPHHARPAIPLRPPPPMSPPNELAETSFDRAGTAALGDDSDRDTSRVGRSKKDKGHKHSHSHSPSVRAAKSHSAFYARAPVSASPLTHTFSSASGSSASSSSHGHARWRSSAPDSPSSFLSVSDLEPVVGGPGFEELDPVQRHYVQAYSAAELRTFHCERVRKMPLSGLDPSMLIGFLCRDEEEWRDLRARIANMAKKFKPIFAVQDEPPNWPSDSDFGVGLESVSEPDIDLPSDDDEEIVKDNEGEGEDEFFDAGEAAAEAVARSPSTSPDPDEGSRKGGSRKGVGSEVDTEEDVEAPITPGPNRSSFDPAFTAAVKVNVKGKDRAHEGEEQGDGDDIEDDWVDPVPMTPPAAVQAPPMSSRTPSEASSAGMSVDEGEERDKDRDKPKKKKKKAKKAPPPPQPQQYFAFPASAEGDEEGEEGADPAEVPPKRRVPQMRTAKARDGGRTQSGGVRAIPTEDGDDF